MSVLTDHTTSKGNEMSELNLYAQEVVDALAKVGIVAEYQTTGGGCDALEIKHTDGGYYLITNGDAQLPGFEYGSGEVDFELNVTRYNTAGEWRGEFKGHEGEGGYVYTGDEVDELVVALVADIPTVFADEDVTMLRAVCACGYVTSDPSTLEAWNQYGAHPHSDMLDAVTHGVSVWTMSDGTITIADEREQG